MTFFPSVVKYFYLKCSVLLCAVNDITNSITILFFIISRACSMYMRIFLLNGCTELLHQTFLKLHVPNQ